MTRQRKTQRREHGTPKRARFRALIEAGFSQRKAAKKVGVKRSTAQGWLRPDQGDRRRRRLGRPSILTDDDIKRVIELFDGSYFHRTQDLRDLAKEAGITCSNTTLWRALRRKGYRRRIPYLSPFLSKAIKARRLKFAQQYRKKPRSFWRRGIYTDELSFPIRIILSYTYFSKTTSLAT